MQNKLINTLQMRNGVHGPVWILRTFPRDEKSQLFKLKSHTRYDLIHADIEFGSLELSTNIECLLNAESLMYG